MITVAGLTKHYGGRRVLIKLTSVRSTKAILALAIGGGLLVTWAVARFVTDEVLYVVEVGFYWTSLTAILAVVVGILLFTSEVQHGTLGVALTIRPSRWTLALSKTVVAAAGGLALGGVGMAAGFAGAALGGIAFGDTTGLVSTVGWALPTRCSPPCWGWGSG